MAFQRVNWQKIGPWALNLENLRHDNHQQGADQRSQTSAGEAVGDGETKHGHLGRSHSTGNQKSEQAWKRISNTVEYSHRGCPDSDLDEDIADWKWSGYFPLEFLHNFFKPGKILRYIWTGGWGLLLFDHCRDASRNRTGKKTGRSKKNVQLSISPNVKRVFYVRDTFH